MILVESDLFGFSRRVRRAFNMNSLKFAGQICANLVLHPCKNETKRTTGGFTSASQRQGDLTGPPCTLTPSRNLFVKKGHISSPSRISFKICQEQVHNEAVNGPFITAAYTYTPLLRNLSGSLKRGTHAWKFF